MEGSNTEWLWFRWLPWRWWWLWCGAWCRGWTADNYNDRYNGRTERERHERWGSWLQKV